MKSVAMMIHILLNSLILSSVLGFLPIQNHKFFIVHKLINQNNNNINFIPPKSSLTLQSTPSTPNGEDIYYLENQFKSISDEKGLLKYKKFCNSDEIQALIEDGLFEKEEFADFWIEVVGDLKKPCTLEQFILINRKIDDEIEEDSEEDGEDSLLQTDTIESITYENEDDTTSSSISAVSNDENISVWSKDYIPTQHMDPNFIKYLKDYFDSKSIDGLLNYTSFYDWSDVKELLVSGNIDVEILKELWLEALAETESDDEYSNGNNSNKSNKKNARKSNVGYKEALIPFDTFLRINIRLNDIIEEVEEAIESLSDEDLEVYFRSEFQILLISENNKNKLSKVVSYKNVMKWNDLQETIIESGLEEEEMLTLWKSVKIPINNNDSGNTVVVDKESSSASSLVMSKGFGTKKDKKSFTTDATFSANSSSSINSNTSSNIKLEAITEDEFVSFNFMLDEYLAQKAPPSPVNWDPVDSSSE